MNMKTCKSVMKMSAMMIAAMVLFTGCDRLSGGENSDIDDRLLRIEEKVDAINQSLNPEDAQMRNEDYPKSSITKEDIVIDSIEYESYLVLMAKNNGKEMATNVEVELIFYGENDQLISYNSSYFSNIAPGMSCPTIVAAPRDNMGNIVAYSRFEMNTKVGDYAFEGTDKSGQIELVHNQGLANNILVKAINKGTDVVDEVNIAIIYKKDGKIVGGTTGNIWGVASNASAIADIPTPLLWEGTPIEYDSYEVSVLSAYTNYYGENQGDQGDPDNQEKQGESSEKTEGTDATEETAE